MRLTRDTLIKIARDTAAQRVRISRRIICIYLTGSLLHDDPLLGGTTDIDLIIVHDSDPVQPREIVRLSDEVHLDIAHYAQENFHHPRRLRADPWLGPFIALKPMLLHDSQHWFEFTQASIGAKFFQPDYTLHRARHLADAARQTWMDLTLNPPANSPAQVLQYLKAIENAGNAIATLSGTPLSERRFFMQFPQRAQGVGKPELAGHLAGLFSSPGFNFAAEWKKHQPEWLADFFAAGQADNAPARLHPARVHYYEKAINALLPDYAPAALWLALFSWARAASNFETSPASGWQQITEVLQLDAAHWDDRMNGLDRWIDEVDETIEQWSVANGALDLEE